MYPFYSSLKSPYTESPPPKVRSGDIIEVMTRSKMEIFGFAVDDGTPFQVHVASLTSAGIATGLVETNKQVALFVYFPIHHAKKLVKRGVNWKKHEVLGGAGMKGEPPTKPKKK